MILTAALAAVGLGLSVAALIAKPGIRPVFAVFACVFIALIWLTG